MDLMRIIKSHAVGEAVPVAGKIKFFSLLLHRGIIYENESTINKIGGTIYESNDTWILAVMAPHSNEPH